MNILHATTDPDLLTRLKQLLGSAARADIAVGYLFVSGFSAVVEEIAALKSTRILVGRTDRPTLEEIARGVQQAAPLRATMENEQIVRRSERGEVSIRAVDKIAENVGRLPQSDAEQRGVIRLCELVASGKVTIRTYPRSMLHAKAYLCWYEGHAEPGSAIVGSSNFTLAGFTNNTELNVRVTGDAEMAELRRWFDALWAESIDVTADLAVELRRSWALASTPPYLVYLKALNELYQHELDTPKLEPRRRGAPELANFQLDAVRRALRMVERHGGCFIGDVVGLGKTFIGAELVRQLQFDEPRGRHPLIVCPAGLIPMWELTSERFGLGAAVVSMSAIVPPPAARFDDGRDEYIDEPWSGGGVNLLGEYPDRGVVLVDEAHNFRRESTRRYSALSTYLRSGDHKVVLLSATPQNLGPADVYYQLRLFLDDFDHGLDLEPLHLKQYFEAVQAWYLHRIEKENWQLEYQRWQLESGKNPRKRQAPPAPPAEPRVPFATIEQVLNPTFIRRRRNDIRELYGDDIEVAGKKVLFPEPVLENVFYRLDKVYARAGTFAEILAQLERHKGARYRAVEYLRPEASRKEAYKDLLRARNRVERLIRFLLVKRLESSVAAFRATLDALARGNRNFRAALAEGFVPIGQTATNFLAGEHFSADELLERLTREEERRQTSGAKRKRLVHRTDDFDTARWIEDLDADYAVLEELRAAVGLITAADDDKLRALRTFLARPDVAAGKVLVFSEAEATVAYLYEQLNPGGADPSIERLSGTNRDRLQQVVKRFAPTANLRPGEALPGPPVRVLLATDVISEGQNLQDCNRVLNYDLHWNPVRLIQRFGRVDRIGTTHQRIFLHNTWPDTDVDAQLSLTERLRRRIQAFHDFIGLDTPLLSETERLNPAAMYRIYEQQRLTEQEDVLDEVAAYQRGIALLQKLRQDDPDLWSQLAKLPDGIRAARPARLPPADERAALEFQRALAGTTAQLPLASPQVEEGLRSSQDDPAPGETVVLFKHGDRPSAFATGSDLRPRQITAGQLVAALECAPDTPGAALPRDTNARVMAAFQASHAAAANRLGRARRPGADTKTRRYVAKQLRLVREQFADDPDELRRIGELQELFLDHLAANVQGELDEVRRMELSGAALIRRLEALRERHRLRVADRTEQEAASMATEVIRTICSEGLLDPR